jgi:hypothetical protein
MTEFSYSVGENVGVDYQIPGLAGRPVDYLTDIAVTPNHIAFGLSFRVGLRSFTRHGGGTSHVLIDGERSLRVAADSERNLLS